MTKDDQGIWSVTVGPLGEQLWGYSFNVDGVKVLDPGNGEYQRDGNRYDNLLMISGPASDLWEFKPDVPHGAVQAVWYPSTILKQKGRRMYVYTPPDYFTSKAKYPVLYLLHGGGGDEDAWTTMGRATDHHGQPDRQRQGQADDRRHAERQRDADRVAGLCVRSDASAAVGDGAGSAAGSGGAGWSRGAGRGAGAPGAAPGAPAAARVLSPTRAPIRTAW